MRYAHHRAVKKDIDVHFAQRLGEDTKFPDGYFDIVSDYILFHEVTAAAAREIVPEFYRVLRPGGVFNHADAITAGNPNASIPRAIVSKARYWNTHRHNGEPWVLDYTHTDFPELLRSTGFDVDLSVKSIGRRGPPVIGIKPV